MPVPTILGSGALSILGFRLLDGFLDPLDAIVGIGVGAKELGRSAAAGRLL